MIDAHLEAKGALLAVLCIAWFTASPGRSPAGEPPENRSDSTSAPARADSALATLHVQTSPESLAVLVDEVPRGRSPLTVALPAGTVRVRAIPPDPRRSDLPWPVAEAKLRPGETTFVVLDLRAPVLVATEPEAAQAALVGRVVAWPDSQLGETPLRLLPRLLETGSLRLSHPGFADTTFQGTIIAASSGLFRVALRRLAGTPYSASKRTSIPVYRKRWFSWTLIGVGAALSGAAVAFHHQGDEWYDRYLASSDVHEIPTLYDQAVHYDHLAAVSLGVGQASLLSGVFLLILGQPR